MAITAASLTSGSDETDSTTYTTASITPTANRLVLAAFTVESTGAQETPTLAGNSLTWVQVATIDGGSGTQRIIVFRALGASPTTGTLVLTASATQVRSRWSIVEFAGIDTGGTDGSSAVVQFKTATGTGTAGTADFDAAFGDAVNNATYSALMLTTGSVGGIVEELGFTELHEVSLAGILETMWRVGEDQTPAPTWVTSRLWTQVVIEIKAAGAGSQTLTGTLFTSAPTFPQGALTQAPAAPAALAATGTGLTTVDVVWDNVANETGFRIERSPNGTTGWVTAGTNAANDLTFTDSGLTCGTTYFYRVYATNASGDSAASNTDSAVTDACPPPPPNTGGNRMGGSGAIRKPPRTVR